MNENVSGYHAVSFLDGSLFTARTVYITVYYILLTIYFDGERKKKQEMKAFLFHLVVMKHLSYITLYLVYIYSPEIGVLRQLGQFADL